MPAGRTGNCRAHGRRQQIEEEHEEPKSNPGAEVIQSRTWLTMRDPRFCHRGIRHKTDDVVDAGSDAAAEIASLEAAPSHGDDDFRQGVGQLEAIADSRSAPCLIARREAGRHCFFVAERPGAKKQAGVRLDLVALERFYRRHNELNAGLARARKCFGDNIGGNGGRNIGGIHDTPGRGGNT